MANLDSINYENVKALYDTLVEAYGTEEKAIRMMTKHTTTAITDALQVTNNQIALGKKASENFEGACKLVYQEVKFGTITKLKYDLDCEHMANQPKFSL